MMTEIWWKVFLVSIATTAALWFFGVSTNLTLLFSLSFVNWAIGVFVLLVAGEWILGKRKGPPSPEE
jgi:hypothetical protein